MALKVIGSGLGRTGTLSLKAALTTLGVGPCHHMVEVFANPASVPLWVAAGKGQADWEAIFDGFRSMVDYPGCRYWRELADYYPEAKVLHSVRDADEWFDSTQATIFAPRGPGEGGGPPGMGEFFALMHSDFAEHIHDRAFMTDYFRRHTEAVIAAIPPERLLVYEAGQGWEPLCAFLGAPIPDEPYPSENSRAEFISRVEAARNRPAAHP
jgi:hypothetical protein